MGTDSLYYIMDYSGNYYRTNQADQLVAVVGEQDATVFTFVQANSRICVGKKASFYCMVPIEEKADDMNVEESKSDDIDDTSSTFPVEEQVVAQRLSALESRVFRWRLCPCGGADGQGQDEGGK